MISLGAEASPGSAPAVAVVAETRATQMRLSGALGGGPSLRLQFVTSLPSLIARGAPGDLVVCYHGTLCSEDCASFKRTKGEFPELLVVAVCEAADGRAIRRGLDSGIDGLVLAGELDAALWPTVAAVLVGQTVVPRNLRTFVRKPSLSAKERQVLGLLVMGFTNSEISTRLFLAESTVKSHLSSAYMKLGVRSRSEAVALLLDPKESAAAGISVAPPMSVASSAALGAVA